MLLMLIPKTVKHKHTHYTPSKHTCAGRHSHSTPPRPNIPVVLQMHISSRDTCPPITFRHLCRHMLWWEEASQLESGHWHLTPLTSTTAVWTHRWLLLNVCISVCCLSALVSIHVLTIGGILTRSWDAEMSVVMWVRGGDHWWTHWANTCYTIHSK